MPFKDAGAYVWPPSKAADESHQFLTFMLT